MNNRLSAAVQMQYMRPGQLEELLRLFPVVYVPLGLIEWHGRHLPLGNVELTAAAIGRKAKELLEALPENQRMLNLPAIRPPHWWIV